MSRDSIRVRFMLDVASSCRVYLRGTRTKNRNGEYLKNANDEYSK